MLKRKRQQKYLIKRCEEMQRQLYAFAESGSQEALHKLRVGIKKIRAFKKMAKLYKGGDEVAIDMKAIKEIFHQAGIIREANINLQMIKEFNISQPAFSIEATRILEQEPGKFRLHTAHYNQQIRSTIKSLLKLLRPVRNSDIRHWFTRQLKKIAVIVTASSTDQLHRTRKRIKNLVYVHGIIHKRLITTLALNITYLDQMQDAIGKWHDTAVALKLLGSHNSEDKAKINKLQKEQDKMGTAIHIISNGFWDKVLSYPIILFSESSS
jgi:CHAD domain-containing protein